MKRSEKAILLKDLASRIHSGCKLSTTRTKEPCTLMGVVGEKVLVKFSPDAAHQGLVDYEVEEYQVKPYLYPLSHLTKLNFSPDARFDTLLDELIEHLNACHLGRAINRKNFNYEKFGVLWFCQMERYECVPHQAMNVVIDFLDRHHIDHRGLIELDLAIDCSGMNIYEE